MKKRPGRNDPCPCGSGKKYKKCCIRGADTAAKAPLSNQLPDETQRTLLPHRYLYDLLTDRQAAKAMWDEVREFYNDKIILYRASAPAGMSHYELNVDARNLRFRNAIIRLDVSSGRVQAAATHELLHLRQPIRGFPRIRGLNYNSVHQHGREHINETMNKATNVIDHDIFVKDFIAMGLPLSEFLTRNTDFDIYEEQATKLRSVNLGQHSWVFWSWWSLEFLRHHISITHGAEQAEPLAESAAKWGARALPDFENCTKQIRQWVATGAHRRPETYAPALQELFRMMRLPPIALFYVLEKVDQNGPSVKAFP